MTEIEEIMYPSAFLIHMLLAIIIYPGICIETVFFADFRREMIIVVRNDRESVSVHNQSGILVVCK